MIERMKIVEKRMEISKYITERAKKADPKHYEFWMKMQAKNTERMRDEVMGKFRNRVM